jgi:hypothetical protein
MVAPARLPDKALDWAYAQAQYELGIKSIHNIALDIGATDSNVSNHATRQGWIRDPLARKRMQEEMEAIAAEKYRAERDKARAEVVSITATMQSTVLVEHRQDIKKARSIITQLLEELSAVTMGVEEFENLAELMEAPDERGLDRLNTVYRRIISMPDRVSSMNTLATALKTLILLERQAFGISGLIEDPEAVRAPAEVTKGLDKIMAKFDAVLALQVSDLKPETSSQPTEIILDLKSETSSVS